MDFSDPDNIYARYLNIDYYGQLGPALMKFNTEDKLIVQIRKNPNQISTGNQPEDPFGDAICNDIEMTTN